MNDDCAIRLTRFPADRDSELLAWKKTTIAIRPITTGKAPLSPLRIRLPQIRTYSPIESASSSADPAGVVMTADSSAGAAVAVEPSSGFGFIDATAQPSALWGVSAAPSVGWSPLPFGLVPVVIQWTADAVSKLAAGPTVTRRPR